MRLVVILLLSILSLHCQAQDSNTSISYQTIFHENGELWIAQKFINNQKVLQESYYENGVLKERFSIKNDKQHGSGVYYFPSGSVQEKYTFFNGKLVGNHEKYYTLKKIRFIRTYNNEKNLLGTGTWFHPDDSIITGTFSYDKEGKIHGVYIKYPRDENCDLLAEVRCYYSHGKEITKEQYFNN